MKPLFVYGTLRPGDSNEHVMKKIGGEWKEASIKGRYINEGWGFRKHGLPALLVDEAGQDIPGYIFISENLEKNWSVLDEFEGVDYDRVVTKAVCTDGEVVDVYVYALKQL
nr:gamma-glutamylcyclotransferase family protein [uncultured Shinella sp.]